MNIIMKIHRHGLRGSLRKGIALIKRSSLHQVIMLIKNKSGYTRWRLRNAPVYENPTSNLLASIERDLQALGVALHDYAPSPAAFESFQTAGWFPSGYHGGMNSGVWHEKLLEHWVAADLLDLMNYKNSDVYVDIAAATSPWAHVLRERNVCDSYAIDLGVVGAEFKHLPYYRIENATNTSFQNESVTGASLQCAFEMFMGADDINLIYELARILKPGGKVVILPLYMHTHHCAYSTPEYFGKGYQDDGAKEYVRFDCAGVPSSRKYDAKQLKTRVLDTINSTGMQYRLSVLRNKIDLGKKLYCHFILEIQK
jgi:hypothetical protein